MRLSNNHVPATGVFRDSEARWILGFEQNIDYCSTLHSKLWAVFDGISIVVEYGMDNLIIVSDNKQLVNMLTRETNEAINFALARRILLMLKRYVKMSDRSDGVDNDEVNSNIPTSDQGTSSNISIRHMNTLAQQPPPAVISSVIPPIAPPPPTVTEPS
ncbi:uncharacterized protein LOC108455402 [Gossypium arboreum]|uniref:uncharacterized protein LOC108455402 n=1 Tax=Gossypium arboreum TaxID=29729 RepID=UPI00081932DC|nr:uncharacterized protein LOC108455402 [Gossypium arboreum]